MRWLIGRVAMALAVSLLVAAVSSPEPSALAFAGILTLTVSAVLTVRYAATLLRVAELRVGHRARSHRELLVSAPAPQHPATPGRTRSRAPAGSLAAA